MINAIKNFIKKGLYGINDTFLQPLFRLSFYKKCAFIILAGIVMYIPFLNTFNASHDEKYTLLMCQFDVFELFKRIIAEDGHPPLHYLYAKLWIELLGGDFYNVLALRLMALSISVLTALLGVFPLRRLLGDKISLLFVAFVFVLPSSIFLVKDMRMYSLAVLLMTGEFIYAMLFLYRKQKGDLVKFALFSLLALYTHYYCGVLSMLIWISVFIDLIKSKKYTEIKHFIISGVVVAVLYIPWLWVFYGQYKSISETWYPKDIHVHYAINGGFFSYEYINDIYSRICMFLGVFSWILVLEYLVDSNNKKSLYEISKKALVLFWGLYFIALSLSIIIRPNLTMKYMVIPVGLLYVALAVAIEHFKKFRKLFFVFAIITFVFGYYVSYKKVNDIGHKEIYNYIKNEIPKNSLIMYDNTRSHLILMFYTPWVDIYYAPLNKYIVLFQPECKKEEKVLSKLDAYDKIYYMSNAQENFDWFKNRQGFINGYDGYIYYIDEISKDKAIDIIKKTKHIRDSVI